MSDLRFFAEVSRRPQMTTMILGFSTPQVNSIVVPPRYNTDGNRQIHSLACPAICSADAGLQHCIGGLRRYSCPYRRWISQSPEFSI